MTLNQDIRWKQHFQNFDRASANNNKALDCRSLSATYRLFPATLRSRLNINFITVTVASLRYACGVRQSILIVFGTRPEAVDAGTVQLVGTDTVKIVTEANRLLDNSTAYETMARVHNPYGDGQAAQRIAKILKSSSNLNLKKHE